MGETHTIVVFPTFINIYSVFRVAYSTSNDLGMPRVFAGLDYNKIYHESVGDDQRYLVSEWRIIELTLKIPLLQDQNRPFTPGSSLNAVIARRNMVEIQNLYTYHKSI